MNSLDVEAIRAQVRTLYFVRGTAITPVPIAAGR
jgi:hypothetical protein